MRHVSMGLLAVVLAGLSLACNNRANVQCDTDPNCNLTTGGVCAVAGTGNHWCAYPDPGCPGGFRYSDQDVGDGVAGVCVAVAVGTGGDAGSPADARSPADASNPADAGNPVDAGSPVCKTRIAFEEGPPSLSPNREVWTTNADGSEPVNVSKAPTADDYSPGWSPDGQKLVFLSNRSGVYDIYVVNADGTNLINLTPSSTDNNTAPAWSPDGAHIAFFRAQRVWTINANGTGAAPLSDRQVTEGFLAWSPDGKKLAYGVPLPPPTPGSFGPIMIFVSTVDNSAMPAKLSSFSAGFESHASWAPAQKIVWDISKDVFVANGDGTSLLNVTQDTAHSNTTPKLTPDGETIVFRSDISGNAELWSVPVSGGTKAPLTHNTIMASTATDASGDLPNSISSDGTLVAFSRVTIGQSSNVSVIGVVDIQGTTTRVFNAPGGMYAHSPTFSPCPSHRTTLALQGTQSSAQQLGY